LHHLLSLLCRLYCFLLAPPAAHYINGGPSLPPPRPAPGKREAFRKNVPVRTPNLHISRLFKDFLLKNIEN